MGRGFRLTPGPAPRTLLTRQTPASRHCAHAQAHRRGRGCRSRGNPLIAGPLLRGRGVAQPGRAPASGAGGRRFESSPPDHQINNLAAIRRFQLASGKQRGSRRRDFLASGRGSYDRPAGHGARAQAQAGEVSGAVRPSRSAHIRQARRVPSGRCPLRASVCCIRRARQSTD